MRGLILCMITIVLSCQYILAQEPSRLDGLDPEDGRYFIVSAVFEIGPLPKQQERVSIFSKLAYFGKNPVGYGLSLRGFQTGVRPQIYWSTGDSEGGFYTFGSFAFRPRHRYVITIVARPGEFMSLYVQERSKVTSKEFPRGENVSSVTFLGGHDLKGVSAPKNGSIFSYKVANEATLEEHAKVLAAVVIVTSKLNDSIGKLLVALDGAPERLAKTYNKNEVRLWEVSLATEP